jgi:integrase
VTVKNAKAQGKAGGMKKVPGRTAKRKRASKGAGRLYKRDSAGKEHSADWNGAGSYWLAYSIPNPDGGTGQRVRIALRDERGEAITDKTAAEDERRRILAPFAAGNQVDAIKAIAAKLQDAEQRHANAIDDANPPLRLSEAWTAYMQAPERPDSGTRTLGDYEGHWTRFIGWITATNPEVVYLRDVNPATAAAYAANLTGAGLSANSYNKHIGFLRMLFRVLSEAARITANPFAKIKRKVQRPHSRRELTIPELTTIIDRANGDLALLLYLGACTGLRLGDCATLQWGDVDLDRGIIRRIPNKTAKSGKPVVVGIPPALHDRLADTPATRRTGYVLPDFAALYQHAPERITNRVKDHLLDCGIDVHAPGTGSRIKRKADGTPERDADGKVITEPTGTPAVVEVGFHSLRHTWVSMHAAAGTPGAVIQASVGHSNPAMTAHYTHVNEITARDVAKALPAFAGNDHAPHREPLPTWARELVEGMTGKTWRTVKAALLERNRV